MYKFLVNSNIVLVKPPFVSFLSHLAMFLKHSKTNVDITR